MSLMKPGRLRRTTLRCPLGEELSLAESRPPNLTAQCKQMKKFCQGKSNIEAQNLRGSVPKSSIPSGDVPAGPKEGKTFPSLKTCTPYARKAQHNCMRAEKDPRTASPRNIVRPISEFNPSVRPVTQLVRVGRGSRPGLRFESPRTSHIIYDSHGNRLYSAKQNDGSILRRFDK